MTDALIPITMFLVLGWIVKTISDNRVRKMLIQKGQLEPSLKDVFADYTDSQIPNALKWGMVLVGIGLGLIVGQNFGEEIQVAMLFIFAGAALVLYYVLARALSRRPPITEA